MKAPVSGVKRDEARPPMQIPMEAGVQDYVRVLAEAAALEAIHPLRVRAARLPVEVLKELRTRT